MALSTAVTVMPHTPEDLEQARQAFIRTKGRPSKFSPEIAAEICSRIETGETMSSICRDAHMPAVPTIHDWKGNLPHFGEALARARQRSASSMVDSGLDMLDSLATTDDVSMVTVRLTEMRHKARFELAKCYDRDQFGDSKRIDQRIQVEHTVGGVIEQLMDSSSSLVIEADLVD